MSRFAIASMSESLAVMLGDPSQPSTGVYIQVLLKSGVLGTITVYIYIGVS